MKLNAQYRVSKFDLETAGYKPTPIHFQIEHTEQDWEYIRTLKPNGFPRFHYVVKNGIHDFHLDRFRRHGEAFPGSIVTYGKIIDIELLRIKVEQAKRKLKIAQENLNKANNNFKICIIN